jgi:hypothetical protein
VFKKSHPWCYENLKHNNNEFIIGVIFVLVNFFCMFWTWILVVIGEYIFYLCACFHVFDCFSFDIVQHLFVLRNISYHIFPLIEFEFCICCATPMMINYLIYYYFFMFSYFYINVEFNLIFMDMRRHMLICFFNPCWWILEKIVK